MRDFIEGKFLFLRFTLLMVVLFSISAVSLAAENKRLLPDRPTGFDLNSYLLIWDTANFYTEHPVNNSVKNFNTKDNSFNTHWKVDFHGWVTEILYLDLELWLLKSSNDLYRSRISYPFEPLDLEDGIKNFFPGFYEPLTAFNENNILADRLQLNLVFPFVGLSLYKGEKDTQDKKSYIFRTLYGKNHENDGTLEVYSANRNLEMKSFYKLVEDFQVSWLYALTRRNGSYGMYGWLDTLILHNILIGVSYANEVPGRPSGAALADSYRNGKAVKQMLSLGYRHRINDLMTIKAQYLHNIYGKDYRENRDATIEHLAAASNILFDYKLFGFMFQAGIAGLDTDSIFGRLANGKGDQSLGSKGSINFKADLWLKNLYGFNAGVLNALAVHSVREEWIAKDEKYLDFSTQPYLEFILEEILPFSGQIGVYPKLALASYRTVDIDGEIENNHVIAQMKSLKFMAKQDFSMLLNSLGLDVLEYVHFANYTSRNTNRLLFKEAGISMRLANISKFIEGIEMTYSFGLEYSQNDDTIHEVENSLLWRLNFIKGISSVVGFDLHQFVNEPNSRIIAEDDVFGFTMAFIWDPPIRKGVFSIFAKFNYNFNPWELDEKPSLNFQKGKLRDNASEDEIFPVLNTPFSEGNGTASLILGLLWKTR